MITENESQTLEEPEAADLHTAICHCGNEYEYELIDMSFIGRSIRTSHECEACAAKKMQELQREEAEQERRQMEYERHLRMERWRNGTEVRYQQTDHQHPDFNAKLWTIIRDWSPSNSQPWLGIIGETGKSKTRCATERMRLAAYDGDSQHPFCVTSYQLAWAVQNQFSDDREEANQAKTILRLAKSADWLLIDDLGKAKHSPAVASFLFALVDQRHARNAATIWTANTMPTEFTRDMPPELAEPIKGRLLECSQIYNLKK